MKIFGVGMNYVNHVKEFGGPVPETPVIFMKPETSELRSSDFYIPDFTKNVHYEVEIVVRIDKVGKNIVPKFAHTYYSQIAIGIDFTARDIQMDLKKKGHPWFLAKGFDGAAALSKLVPLKGKDIHDINFGLKLNGQDVQKGNTKDMVFKVDTLISFISSYCTLKKGDLIYTGTPEGVGPVSIGDRLEAYIEDEKQLEVNIK